MKLINCTAVCESKPGHAFSGSYTVSLEDVCVFAYSVACRRIAFHVVIKVDEASVELNDMSNLIDETFQCVFEVNRSSERAGDLIKRIDFAVSFLYLIVCHVR